MAQVTNLNFSTEELQVLKNTYFFKLKLRATKKVIELFSEIEDVLRKEFASMNFQPSEEVLHRPGKIFRGENYLNLPYVVLDYPRYFSKDSVFAFRTMFWWGHGYSFTLHLQGEAWEKHKEQVILNLEKLQDQEMYICVGESPWQYHYGEDNYISLEKLIAQGRKSELSEKTFFKISSRLEIYQYESALEKSVLTFRSLIRMLKDQEPM